MNINMNDKFQKMHKDIMNVCINNDIRLIAGRRVSWEILYGEEIRGSKEFLLLPDDMKKFYDHCVDILQRAGYVLQKVKIQGGAVFKVYRKDMLATTVSALMSDPEAKHCPQFFIRELVAEDDKYRFKANGKNFSFKKAKLEDLSRQEYLESFVYTKENIEDHLATIYGSESVSKGSVAGYGLFVTECLPEDFIEEAKARGYLSEERLSRYKEYRTWRKENRNLIEKKYREYQENLLGLELPY